MNTIREQLLAVFDVEHREHLGAIRRELAAAAQGAQADLIDVLRRAHTLKGAARAVNLLGVEQLAHRLESAFSDLAEGRRTLDRHATDAISLALDTIEDQVAAVLDGKPEPDARAAINALDAALEAPGAQVRREGLPATPETAIASDRTEEAPVKQPQAPPAPVKQPQAPPAPIDQPQPPPAPSTSATFLTIPAEIVGDVDLASYELALAIQQIRGMDAVYQRLEADVRRLEQGWAQLRRASPAAADNAQDAALSKAFHNELRALSRELLRLNRRRQQVAWSVGQATGKLRDKVEHLSLVPAETVFGGFSRMLREIAREEGHAVELVMTGLDLLADMALLQALKDPIMHILRNAVSHGAESVEMRRAKGKPDALTIRLELQANANQLVVEVSDDGRGLDFARIAEVAAARRLEIVPIPGISREEQLASLLIQPGFSTRPEVDRLSGRGIGLSVVHESVRRLHGFLDIRPGNPWGTTALISVPLSASRQILLIVEAEGVVYGLPVAAVERVMKVRAEDLESVGGQPVVEVKWGEEARPVPVAPLASLVHGRRGAIPLEAGTISIVLLKGGARRYAVAVDSLQDAAPFIIEDPEIVGADRSVVAGTVVLEDGAPALVLSAGGLIDQWSRLSGDSGHGALVEGWGASADEQVRERTILVVDDSITTRTLEKNLLESQGYRVIVSVDGIDALTALGNHPEIDLVVADIEMPRMDGFGLLQAMKNDARLESIPVILMTSRAAAEDVRRGLDLGADAYLTKQKFDQRELLTTINQLL